MAFRGWLPLRFDAEATFQREFGVFQAPQLTAMASDRGKPFSVDALDFDFAFPGRCFLADACVAPGAVKRVARFAPSGPGVDGGGATKWGNPARVPRRQPLGFCVKDLKRVKERARVKLVDNHFFFFKINYLFYVLVSDITIWWCLI